MCPQNIQLERSLANLNNLQGKTDRRTARVYSDLSQFFIPSHPQFGIIFTTFHHLQCGVGMIYVRYPYDCKRDENLPDFLHFRLVIPALLSVSKRAPEKTFFAERGLTK